VTTTITEALAELKTIGKRLEKKEQFVLAYLMRPESVRDPLEKEGGTAQAIARELQSIRDLNERVLSVRRAIQLANNATTITVGRETRSISDWLVWRREVAPTRQRFLASVRQRIDAQRNSLKGNAAMVATNTDSKPGDIVVNVSELELANDIENMENVLGYLDGQLSLRNATVLIDV
jgi:hypothetical protein